MRFLHLKNLDQLKKELAKQEIYTTFSTPTEWLSTGIYALNFTMSGTFQHGIPNKRSTFFWGPSGAGKTFLLANAAKHAQDKGYHILYLDSENAIDREYMTKIGLDLSEDKFTPINVTSIEDVTKTMAAIFSNCDPTDKLFVGLDSISMLLSEKEEGDFTSGDMKGDQGQQAKKLKLLMKNINSKIGNFDMFFVGVAHAYQNQNVLNGEGNWILSGGKGIEFIPSISVLLTKLKLKEGSDIVGVKIRTEVTKTRFTKLGGKTEIEVPYDTGFDPYSGLLEMAVAAKVVTQAGAWYKATINGNEEKFRAADFSKYADMIFDLQSKDLPAEEEP